MRAHTVSGWGLKVRLIGPQVLKCTWCTNKDCIFTSAARLGQPEMDQFLAFDATLLKSNCSANWANCVAGQRERAI